MIYLRVRYASWEDIDHTSHRAREWRWDAAVTAAAAGDGDGGGRCGGGSPDGAQPPPFLRVWYYWHDDMWSGRRAEGRVTLVGSTLGWLLRTLRTRSTKSS
jgi:hypothetical protein